MSSNYPFDSHSNQIHRHQDAWKEINEMQTGFEKHLVYAKQSFKEDIGEFVTKITNRGTTKFLEKLYDTIMISGEPVQGSPDSFKIPEELGALIEKTMDLYDENVDIEKSLKRGFRDLMKGNPLKTEFREKVKEQVLDPLREYVNREGNQTFQPQEEIITQLDALEERYVFKDKSKEYGEITVNHILSAAELYYNALEEEDGLSNDKQNKHKQKLNQIQELGADLVNGMSETVEKDWSSVYLNTGTVIHAEIRDKLYVPLNEEMKQRTPLDVETSKEIGHKMDLAFDMLNASRVTGANRSL